MTNPSAITIKAGDLAFDVIMDASGSSVGTVVLQDTIIKPGVNELPAKMKMASTDLLSLSKMLTAYLTGQSTPLTVKGNMATSNIIPLQPGLSKLALKTVMTGLPPSLVVENQMKLVGLSPNIWVKFYNPLDTPYTVSAISAEVYFYLKDGTYTKLGSLAGAVNPPVTVPAKGNAVNENPLILNPSSLGTALQFIMLSPEQKKVDLFQNVTVVVGEGFHGGMYYEQKGVPVVDRDSSSAAAALALISQYAPSTVTSSIVPQITSAAVPEATTTEALPVTSTEAVSTDPTNQESSSATSAEEVVSAEPTVHTVVPEVKPTEETIVVSPVI